MITAQDVREKTFEKAKIGGYAMNEVDDFLDELAEDLAASQKETAVLNKKMKVLVDKIEEYRGAEDDMRKALLSAQKVAREIETEAQEKADALVSEAQAKADAILAAAQAEADAVTADAQAKANEVLGDLVGSREREERRLRMAQESTAEYLSALKAALSRQQDNIDVIEQNFIPEGFEMTAAPAVEEPAVEAAAEPAVEAAAEPAQPDFLTEFENAVYGEKTAAEEPAADTDATAGFSF